jgi:basic amino acid/polyamine antiporter, APA family
MVLIATGTFQKLVAVASFFLALNYFVCCMALIVLRRREPGTIRPFRAWGYPWFAGLVAIGAAAFLVGALLADTSNALLALGLFAAGLIGRTATGRRRMEGPGHG